MAFTLVRALLPLLYGDNPLANQAWSFSRARNRWDILFFSALSISAYLRRMCQFVDFKNTQTCHSRRKNGTHVCPSYSKTASQPV